MINKFTVILCSLFFTFKVYGNCEVVSANTAQNNVPARINFGKVSILNNTLQPLGSLIKQTVVPATSFNGGSSPELILWRCDKTEADKIYLMVKTNSYTDDFEVSPDGDNGHAGYFHGKTSSIYPVNGFAYHTRISRAALRLTMAGTVFKTYWQKVNPKPKLGYDVDPKDANKILIKIKHIPPVTAELFKTDIYTAKQSGSNCSAINPNDNNIHNDPSLVCAHPNGYVQLAGFANNDIYDLEGSIVNNFLKPKNGFGYSMQRAVWVYNQPTCQVIASTGVVYLPQLNKQNIKNFNEQTQAPFNVTLECTGHDFSNFGTSSGKTSLFFEMSEKTYNLINQHESGLLTPQLVTTGYTSTHLISDNYGQDGYAKGVGVAVKFNDTDVNFVYYPGSSFKNDTDDETGHVSKADNARLDLTNVAVFKNNTSDGYKDGDKRSIYTVPFTAILKKLPTNTPVTAGKVEVTAKITLRVN